MKRGLLLIGLFTALFLTPLLFAQTGTRTADPFGEIAGTVGYVVTGIIQAISPIMELVIGIKGGEQLFVGTLLFLLILGVVWITVDQIEFLNVYPWVHAGISVVIAILAARIFADAQWVQTILLPYSVLGVAITAGLPFVIYFLIVNVRMKNNSSMLRRIAWIFFFVIFISMWSIRREEFGNITNPLNPGNIYLWTALLSLIMIVFDGTVGRVIHKIKLDKIIIAANEREIDQLLREIHKAGEDLSKSIITIADHRKKVSGYRRRINELKRL